jgi:hypothetical protein
MIKTLDKLKRFIIIIKNLDNRHRPSGQMMIILNYLSQIHHVNIEIGQQVQGKFSVNEDMELVGQILHNNNKPG